MKLAINRKILHDAITTVGRAVTSRSTLPILHNLLLEAEGEHLTLTATDLELGIRCRVPCAVAAPGALTAPAKTFAEIVAALPEGEVALSLTDRNTAVLTSGRAEYRILGLPPEEYPALPEVADEVTATLPAGLLHRMLRSVLPSVGKDDTRPILTGVETSLSAERLSLAATDTYRLAARFCAAEGKGERVAILPGTSLQEVLRACPPESEEPVTISMDLNQCQVTAPGVVLVTRLIDGQFPRWEKVVPKAWTTRITADVDDLRERVRRVAVIARENAGRLQASIAEGVLTLSAQSGELGNAREEMEVAQEGKDLAFTVNVRFLLDALGVVEGEQVVIEGTAPLAPLLLRDPAVAEMVLVLMPMTEV